MFNINAAVTAFLSSNAYLTYLRNLYLNIEKLIQTNCYDKIKALGQKKTLKLVLGEATQNLDNFIYGNNSKKVATNSFLTPSILLGKSCGKGSGFKASDLHDYLAEKTIAAVDLFPIPLPSELYNTAGLQPILTDIEGLGGEQSEYIDQKVQEIVDLAISIGATEVKVICRYSKSNVTTMGDIFIKRLAKALAAKGMKLTVVEGDLSNTAGGLDLVKFMDFCRN